MSIEENAQSAQLGDFSRVDATDPEGFVARLDQMHALASFQSYKKSSFDLLRLSSGSCIADIGCGTGDDAANLTSIVSPDGKVTGFDLSEGMVAQARARHDAVANLSFEVADSENIPMPDASLDAVRCDRVLIHVPDPEQTLNEMVRVLRPGGRLVVSEPDMPSAWMSSDDDLFSAVVMSSISNSCKTPHLPRNLFGMLKDRCLGDIDLTINPIVCFNAYAVNKILNISGVVHSLIERGAVERSQAEMWLTGLFSRQENGRFASGLCIFTLAGTKL